MDANYPFDMLLLLFVFNTIALVAHCDIKEFVTLGNGYLSCYQQLR